ncbi:hypothetical protein DRN75_03990 [Nanoarchaeota archaeon]|nr:MAG: hypothetical protein DRN75_03990 [Nanoarchaeota archaeon]
MALEETKVDEEFVKAMSLFREKPKGKDMMTACSENIVLFSEHMLGIKLYSWQVKFLTDISDPAGLYKTFLALTSRQIGKSTAVAIFSIWAGVFNKYAGTIHNNTIIGITSASDTQAKKLLYEIKKIMMSGDRYMENTYKDDQGKSIWNKFFSKLLSTSGSSKAADKGSNNTTTITFRPWNEGADDILLKGSMSGSIIKSYPPTSVILGETFTVIIIDEAGKNERISDEFFYDYITPTGNSTNAIRIYLSTPWVPAGFFYRSANPADEYEDDPSIKKLLFSIEAIELENPNYYSNVKKQIDRLVLDGKKDEVDRGYYCRFVKGERSYFDPDGVRAIFEDTGMVDSYEKPCDLGVDFGGQTTSKTVLTVSALDDNGLIQRLWHKTYEVGQDNSIIEDIEAEVLPFFNIQRVIPDMCPQGDYIIRQMVDKGWSVEPMSFRKDKVKKYGAFRSMLRRGKIRSYNDIELQVEMLGMEFSQGSKQSVIQHAAGYSDDLIDSFVMSAYFFVENEGEVKMFSWEGI